MAKLALEQNVAALLRLTQRQLFRNWLVDSACRALWWPASLTAIAGGAALAGFRAPWLWLAAAGVAIWIMATLLHARQSRSSVPHAAKWLDRVSDSKEIFVTAEYLLADTRVITPAAEFVLARAQRRLPTARVRSAAHIGWKVPKHLGVALLLGLGGLAALARPANDGSERQAGLTVNADDAAAFSAKTAVEAATETRPALAQSLAKALEHRDAAPAEAGNETVDPFATVSTQGQVQEPDSTAKTPVKPSKAGAAQGSDAPALASDNARFAKDETEKSGRVPASGRGAGDNQADQSNSPVTRSESVSAAKTIYADFALPTDPAMASQHRAGAALLRSIGRPLAPATRVGAAAASPDNIPMPADFGPAEIQFVSQYFYELNADK